MNRGTAGTEEPESARQWTVHLARRHPWRAAGAVALVGAGAVSAAVGFGSRWAGALAAWLLLGAIRDFLFPLRFAMDERGVSARGLLWRKEMTWEQVRRVVRDGAGVKLSPLAQPSRLEAYRGIYLWFADNAEDVMDFVTRRMEAASGGSGRLADPSAAGGRHPACR